jgi:hypothetical protein
MALVPIIPAQAGIQTAHTAGGAKIWVPASAGTSGDS